MIPEMFEREALLIGEKGVEKLNETKVMIFGVGGVGGYTLEGLVRAGVGKIVLVDNDDVSINKINRQIIADNETVGKHKVEIAKQRAKRINPEIEISIEKTFVTKENAGEIIEKYNPDYIVDAIDTVSAKIAIIEYADKKGIRIVSSMGTGNKLDPERLRIVDIYKTTTCPLARVMRKELKERGIKKLSVLCSDEIPVKSENGNTPVIKENSRNAPGSISFVPSVGGLIIAAKVVRDVVEV